MQQQAMDKMNDLFRHDILDDSEGDDAGEHERSK
jgi:hypothetical protein